MVINKLKIVLIILIILLLSPSILYSQENQYLKTVNLIDTAFIINEGDFLFGVDFVGFSINNFIQFSFNPFYLAFGVINLGIETSLNIQDNSAISFDISAYWVTDLIVPSFPRDTALGFYNNGKPILLPVFFVSVKIKYSFIPNDFFMQTFGFSYNEPDGISTAFLMDNRAKVFQPMTTIGFSSISSFRLKLSDNISFIPELSVFFDIDYHFWRGIFTIIYCHYLQAYNVQFGYFIGYCSDFEHDYLDIYEGWLNIKSRGWNMNLAIGFRFLINLP